MIFKIYICFLYLNISYRTIVIFKPFISYGILTICNIMTTTYPTIMFDNRIKGIPFICLSGFKTVFKLKVCVKFLLLSGFYYSIIWYLWLMIILKHLAKTIKCITQRCNFLITIYHIDIHYHLLLLEGF